MKVISVVGARPQFIKAAMVSRSLRDFEVQELLVHTGQHYDNNMSDLFFQELGIPKPRYTLGIGSGLHGVQTGRMLSGVEEILMAERPDWVLVYGDTNSTLAGALAAAKLHLPVAHVEAGLRSFNRRMPEEINRVMTDHVSTLLLAPTTEAVDNLAREGIVGDGVQLVGDVMYDAALYFGERADRESEILRSLGLEAQQYVLATVHRAENTDHQHRLSAIIDAFEEVSRFVPVVLPLHPRTRTAVERLGWLDRLAAVHVIEPVGYLDMVALEKSARVIATDSGGVQKEAFFHRVPCVTLREETEWRELVSLGWNQLVTPLNAQAIVEGIFTALQALPGAEASPYGEGAAALRIAKLLRV